MSDRVPVYFSVRDLAARLDVSLDFVRDRLREGAFPHSIRLSPGVRGDVRIPDSDILAWLAARPHATTTRELIGAASTARSPERVPPACFSENFETVISARTEGELRRKSNC